jgi:hypothetical protein
LAALYTGQCNAFERSCLPRWVQWRGLIILSWQVERNLHDAMGVARNVLMDPRLVPGGGAVEMAISRGLADRAASLQGAEQVCMLPFLLLACTSQASRAYE